MENYLCTPLSILYYKEDSENYYTASTKTQFAGPGVHITLLQLLKHLSTKYFSSIEVIDEGLYWNKWNEEILKIQFEKYSKCFKQFELILNELVVQPGESEQSLVDKIEDILKKKWSE